MYIPLIEAHVSLSQAEWVQPTLSNLEAIPGLSHSCCLSLDFLESVPAFLARGPELHTYSRGRHTVDYRAAQACLMSSSSLHLNTTWRLWDINERWASICRGLPGATPRSLSCAVIVGSEYTCVNDCALLCNYWHCTSPAIFWLSHWGSWDPSATLCSQLSFLPAEVGMSEAANAETSLFAGQIRLHLTTELRTEDEVERDYSS